MSLLILALLALPARAESDRPSSMQQLTAASSVPSSAVWADGSLAAADNFSEGIPSPVEVGEKYEGFEKGFSIGFTAVEWAPNWIAREVPGVGEPIGGVLGLALAPVGLLVGAAGGLMSFLLSLF